MKKTILLIAGMFLSVAALMAQSPAPEPDTLKDPVKQTDPGIKVFPQNNNYHEEHIKITPQQIPAAVRQTLSSGVQYEGWEKASIYKNKSGNMFIVEVRKADATLTYRFNKTGKPVND